MVNTISLLYVDDDEALLDIGKMCLERTKEFQVTTVSSATAALDLLKSHEIQAIVSDYQMPGMNGIEFLKKVRAADKLIPFIMFTGKGREDIAVEAFENGADFYLQKGGAPKPQFAELVHKIHAAVDHRRADARNITLNRLYTVLSASNKAILRIHDKTELLSEICRIVVDTGGFRMAWAGFSNEKTHLIEPVASYGYIDGYLDTLSISTNPVPRGKGPTGTAFREKRYNICNDIATDPKMTLWRDGALRRGYRSLAAFPFAPDTKNAGVITFYASETGFFDDQIIRLLKEQSGDITFAFATLDHEEQRIASGDNLMASELRYRRLFETAQDAILILDGDTGKIIDANKFILDLLGYPLEFFVGKYLWELGLIKDKSLAEKAFTELKTNGYIRYEDLPLETKQGTVTNVEFVSNLYMVGDKRIIQCNIRDITERKQAEHALFLANRKLTLLSSITRHDILNQLTTLLGYLELSQKLVPESSAQEFIKKEITAAEAIRRLINFTGDYEEMGVNAPAWQNISSSIRNITASLPLGNVKLIIDGPEIDLFADPLLEKVFYNLIDNAIRYGGEKMQDIRVTSREINGSLVLIIADDGAGILPEEKIRLFTKGFGKNTGFGLFLSREILSITGITISETGEPGKGARFEILVPAGAWRYSGEKTRQ